MFHKCKLEIAQLPNPDKPHEQKWLHVTLQRPRRIDIRAKDDVEIDAIVKQCVRAYGLNDIVDKGIFSGSWSVGINSQTASADTAYTIGGSEPQNQKFWLFLSANRQLWFVQYSRMTGGGAMSLGKDPIDFVGAMTLRNAWISSKGIYPAGNLPGYFGPSEEPHGSGSVHPGAYNRFFDQRQPVWWSLLSN